MRASDCIICLALQKLLGAYERGNLQVRASYLEIYNEDVRDLLASNPRTALELREDADGGVYAKGLHAFLVQSPADMASVLQVAARLASCLGVLITRCCACMRFLFRSPDMGSAAPACSVYFLAQRLHASLLGPSAQLAGVQLAWSAQCCRPSRARLNGVQPGPDVKFYPIQLFSAIEGLKQPG